MKVQHLGSLGRDLLYLPAYWSRGRRVRSRMHYHQHRLVYGPHPRQYVLVLEPVDTPLANDRPWCFYFHGGAWTFGRPEQFIAAARPWLEAGFRVVLPSYRRPPRYRLPRIIEDLGGAAGAVVRFAQRRSLSLQTDLHTAGMSAGGHLAAYLALHSDWWPVPVSATACFAAPLDLRLLRPSLLFRDYAPLNPTELAGRIPGEGRWLLVQGQRDGIVDPRHAERFSAVQPNAAVLRIADGGHLAACGWAHDDGDAVLEQLRGFIGGVPTYTTLVGRHGPGHS